MARTSCSQVFEEKAYHKREMNTTLHRRANSGQPTFILGSSLYDPWTISCKKDVRRLSGHDSRSSISINFSVLFHESRKSPWLPMYMSE